ncbi:MAG: sigma-70 family RNA polymerase sigma factor [Actinomycetia bacterium]|nr:sigma-70 family RNA polymerase sigma factor [Actinomycetes bacterium]
MGQLHQPVDSKRTQGKRLSHEQVERLVIKAAAGSRDAFAQLYEAYLPQIYFYSRKRLNSDDEAIEVVQDTFLAALMRLDRLKNPRAFHSWIYSIASAYVIGTQRRESAKIQHEQSLDLITDRIDAAASTPAAEPLAADDDATLPEAALDNKETRLALISAIDALGDAQKEAILLRYYAGLSIKEITAVLGETQNVTLKRLHDARVSLRKRLTVDDTTLSEALQKEETGTQMTSTKGLGAQVTLGIAGALPLMLTDLDGASTIVERAQAFTRLANKAHKAAASHAGVPLAAKVALATAACALVTGGAYTLWRSNTQAPEPTRPVATETRPPAANSTPASSPEATKAAASDTKPAAAKADTARTAAPASQAQQPQRPVITVPSPSLSYATGTTPLTAAQLIAASGATAKAADGTTLPVTLSSLGNINWAHAGAYLCYLHARDSAGTYANKQVLTINVM